jgi:hypothetical protein
VIARRKPQMFRNSFADIGKPNLANCTTGLPRQLANYRHPLARMIGAFPCRIVAMIGSENDKVAGPKML